MRAKDILNEDWQKVNKKDKTDGMSSKAVKAYRRENPGSKLKTAVTKKPSELKAGSKDANRRKSFCARMSGMKKAHASAKTKRDPDSPINKALRRWNCESVEQSIQEIEQQLEEAKKKTLKNSNPCWKGYHPVGTKKKSGRTVPNCVPNESIEEAASAAQQAAIAIAKKKKKQSVSENTHSNITMALPLRVAIERFQTNGVEPGLRRFFEFAKDNGAVTVGDAFRIADDNPRYSVWAERIQDLRHKEKHDDIEGSLEEYGDSAKGQKMLTKVQKRAVDRMIKADDKRDAKAAKKNQDTANRAWDRMTDKDVAEGKTQKQEAPKPRNFVAKNAINTGAGAHKDKKKEQKQGNVKHKGKMMDLSEMEEVLERASRQLCKSSKPDDDLGASNLASCKSQGYRARDGEKSHLITSGQRKVRIKVGGKKIKGKKYGGPLPDYGTRKGQ